MNLDELVELDFNSKYIIHFLSKNLINENNKEEIRFRISQLNLNQFLKVLNEVMPTMYDANTLEISGGMDLTIDNMELFFEFISMPDEDYISHLYFKCNTFIDKDIDIKKNKINDLLDIENRFNKENGKSLSLLIKSLEFLKPCVGNKLEYHFTSGVIIGQNSSICNASVIEFILDKLEIGIPYIKFFENDALEPSRFNFSINKEILSLLYQQLKRYDFLNEDKTSEIDFLNVFTLDWGKNDSEIFLKMDNPQTHLFFSFFDDYFDIKITLSQIERSKKVKNKNGLLKANSVYASGSKSIFPKREDTIREIFENVKKG
ncbi:hypothetical protein MHTCC0001_16750 [Flavobacteriaceae bacterium MHTCC 0001]